MEMPLYQMIQHGLLWGLIFGAVFRAATLILARINAEMLLSDYPSDIRLSYGAMSPETRRQANLAGLLLMAVLLGVIVLALIQLRTTILYGRSEIQVSFSSLLTLLRPYFLSLLVMLQVWNLIDLLVLDWFILMTLRPAFMILPGTAGLAGYHDYGSHFRKFLNGRVLTVLLSGVLALAAVGLEAVL